jgi:hypothetical protein
MSDGKYYSSSAPYLSTLAAVCAGSRSERDKFSRGHSYTDLCRVDYHLTEVQAKSLTDVAANPAEADFVCVPTTQQLDEVINQLFAELENKQRAQPPASLPKFDPALTVLFPTLFALYDYYIAGSPNAQKPVDWVPTIRNEFDTFKSTVW